MFVGNKYVCIFMLEINISTYAKNVQYLGMYFFMYVKYLYIFMGKKSTYS